MQYIFLDNTERRTVTITNFNQHIRSPHPDRIMEEHDMIYIRSGNWVIGQDDTVYELSEGDVIFLHAGHRHYGIPPCNSVVNTCFIHLSAVSSDCVYDCSGQAEDKWVFPAVVHCQNNPMIEQYFHRIIHSHLSDDVYERKKADAYLDLLLAELCISDHKASRSSVAENAVRIIKMHPERFISSDELAEHLNYSIRSISSEFKRTMNTTPHKYQLELKCKMADELMKYDPSVTLKEVASTYGFYDEYHFGKCYKSIFGYSPKRKK